MKKLMVLTLAAALAVFVGSWPGEVEQVAYAAGHGGGGHGGGAGGHVGGGHFDGGHHGGGHFGVWFGPGWGWDPFFYPYYPYYPYYNSPTVIVPQQPEEYVMPEAQPEGTDYWYFCNNPKGYYPYVKSCPGGWMKVVPAPAPPGEED